MCVGTTPANVVIEAVMPYPPEGQQPFIVLRNMGGQLANLSGWRLTDGDTRTVEAAMNLVFGQAPCDNAGNVTIEPSRSLTLKPKSDAAPCGFPFGINYR